jgi:phospholipid/cholesterol/gamma-HCH transport system permease protein
MTSYCSIQTDKTPSAAALRLEGRWTVAVLPEIERNLKGLHMHSVKRLTLDGAALTDFDTAGAWLLNTLVKTLKEKGVDVSLSHFKDGHRRIFERISSLPQEKGERRRNHRPRTLHLNRIFRHIVAALGEQLDHIWEDWGRGIGFLGAFLVSVAQRIFQPKHLRVQSIVFHVNEIGIKAIPIIALMAFSIAFVMGYQGAFQLRKFDATVYTIDLVVLSILREMGVLITAIMVAGRSGSAFAAQLGTMKLNEEVDALKTMNVAPFEVLVLPRLIAILIALPLLTIVGDTMGLLGGYIFSASYLDYSYVQFLSRMQQAADMTQFYVGLSKAPVFAILIGIVGCMQGLKASGSAEDVGRKTITAVVQSIFLVVVADALFSVIFTKMGI